MARTGRTRPVEHDAEHVRGTLERA